MSRATFIRRTTAWTSTFVMASFGFTGIASAQTIQNTGPGSNNTISTAVSNDCTVQNTNTVSATNRNSQSSNTGSTNVSGNTSAGASWGGWSGLSPQSAQAGGFGYSSWNSGITNWISQRASGNGWNSTSTDLSWTPSGSDWDAWNPVTWQTNGQSFGNWYNGVMSYLDGNSSMWMFAWPSTATGTGNFGGASSGNAMNSNSANFSISVNNAARALAGTNACGQSNFTPPTGGMGGGSWTPPSAPSTGTSSGGQGGAGSGWATGSSSWGVPTQQGASSSAPQAGWQAPADPAGGHGGGWTQPNTPVAPTGGASIGNTGPGSNNTISSSYQSTTTVTNNTNVSINNSNSQSSNTGSTNVSGNTSAWGAGSGDASNGNNTGTDFSVSN